MIQTATESTVHTIRLDIAKNSISVHGFDEAGTLFSIPVMWWTALACGI
jgi:hypothetical protein